MSCEHGWAETTPVSAPTSSRLDDFACLRIDVESGDEVVFGLLASADVCDHKVHEILVPIDDLYVLNRCDGVFTGPDGLARGPVPIEPGTTGGHPVAQPLPRVNEVPMPAERCASGLLRVVGAQPVQVQGAQLQTNSQCLCHMGGITLAGRP